MTFDFYQLIAHAAKNTFTNVGNCCQSRKSKQIKLFSLKIIKDGKATTPFMSFGDRIEVEMKADSGTSIFGKINQVVKEYKK